MSQIPEENVYGQNTLRLIKDNAEKLLCFHAVPIWYYVALSFNDIINTKLVLTLCPDIGAQCLAVTC